MRTPPSSGCRRSRLSRVTRSGPSRSKLMAAVDESIPDPVRETDKPFLMPVEDVFTITGRGTVVTGRVERGSVKVNEEVEIVGIREKSRRPPSPASRCSHKLLDSAEAGDNAGLLLRGLKREGRRAWPGHREAGHHHPAHRVRGPGVHPVEGRGRPPPRSSTTTVRSSTSVPPT